MLLIFCENLLKALAPVEYTVYYGILTVKINTFVKKHQREIQNSLTYKS